jgi:subtilisin family serine protease
MIFLMKQNSSGDTLFVVNWNGDGDGEDYAMDMVVDPSNEYVYIVGGSDQNGTDSLDAVILAIDDTGMEIFHTYSSENSGYNDLYTAISSDGIYFFACGSIGTNSAGHDFLITEYEHNGTEIYSETYDYVGLDDVALQIVAVAGNSVVVAGVSEPTDTTWDYYIREYKLSTTPSFAHQYRNYAGSGQTHRPTDAVFKNNYYYITGGVLNGTQYDIKTVCMDTALTVIWEQTYDGPDGMSDGSNSIKVDGDGNAYVTGHVRNANNVMDMVTIKYDQYGNEKWVNFYDGSDGTLNDRAWDLELNGSNVYVTGSIKDWTAYNTMCYDTAGNTRWMKASEAIATYPADLAVDGDGNIIMAAPLWILLYTEKLSILEVSNEVITDTADVPICKKNEMIVKFNPGAIKPDIIDNRDKVFGRLTDFIQDSTINKMAIKLNNDLKDIYAIKIFKRFTTADSLSITRLGDTIKIEEIWSTLLITTLDTADLVEWMDSLRTIEGDIFYVEANLLGDLLDVPDDSNYGQQDNLHSTMFPNAYVKIEDAWNKETGRDFIRVGVYDTGVNWIHPDFSRNNSGTFAHSCAKNGYDYNLNLPNTSSITYPGTNHHGTRVAGIIGARRDNSIGVAGIAGGNNNTDTLGVELYGFKLTNGLGEYLSVTTVADAVMEGGYLSLNTVDNFGYAINVANHSYAFGGQYFIGNPAIFYTLRKAYYYSWRMGVTHAAGRGNYPKLSYSENEVLIPACLHDDWIITVGANGWDGERKTNGNGFSGNTSDFTYVSMNGQPEIDCIAPGTMALIKYTTDSTTGYKSFNGTSAATPHVSGVAALVLSYYNNFDRNPYSNSGFNNLCSDDIDHLIERYSSDRESSGHDNNTGWGLLNADSIFQHIEKPRFDIVHFKGDDPVSKNSSLDASLVTILVDEPTNGFYGEYIANRYAVTATFNHTLPSGYSLVDYWPLKSHSVGMRNDYNPLPQFPSSIEILSCNDTTITLRTFVYYTIEDVNTSQAILNWLVFDDGPTKFPYALHIQNPTAGINEINNPNVQVFPNPTSGLVNIGISSMSEFNYIILDVNGKIHSVGSIKGTSNSIDLSNFASSIYFIKIFNNSYIKTFKIIKN